MASGELELRQQIAEAKTEEKSSAQFNVDQVFDSTNDYLKSVLAKLTSIPILFEAQPNGLYFGCYSSEHIVKFSKSRKSCQMRNRKHPRPLHDHNWTPEEVKTEGRSSQH
ncbi:unnamed protein product [Pocillopora meandrina]|uniref:Uncharacterized protein n=1 Tax=Pocillopora meandrina TaxID=46732 RepID=A0AAU9WSH1_9CNID|nr:unnamed protein product [Pocillopora meandrina]